MSEFYENPLCTRYAGDEMKRIFSSDNKFSTWRKLWVALAEAEKELGIDIKQEQIDEMKAHILPIDYALAAKYEHELRHDVMAHVYTFGDACPKARPIIHLGATSCYVGDNTDIIQMKEGLLQVRKMLVNAINAVAEFAEKHKRVPTLAYTHFQAAQPTTAGKRATLWLQDLITDLDTLDYTLSRLKLLGCKGTTGTGASFLALFSGNKEKVKELEKRIAEKMGFENKVVEVSGQTYSRKTDFAVLSCLASIAQSAAKFSNDIRLLSHLKEFDEPFEKKQIGSSAMAYKRNPMRSERIASLARYVMVDLLNPAITASAQWFERTLDDSANRRISIPEAFLAVDGILSIYINVISGGTLYPKVMEKHLMEELPFMATENILMHGVQQGGDRQELHELIRQYSVEVAKNVKMYGKENNLMELIKADARFKLTKEDADALCDPMKFVGLAPEQTEEYLNNTVYPLLRENADLLGVEAEVNV